MKTRKILAIAFLTLFSAIALAGMVVDGPVEIVLNEDGSGQAIGNMTSARYSDNDVEYIGCGTRNIDVGGGNFFQFAFCQAGDAAEELAFCSTQNPDLVGALEAIADHSFVIFSFDANGECTRIGFSTQSFYLPEAPKKTAK